MIELASHQQDVLLGLQRAWLHLYESVSELDEGEVKERFLRQLTDCLCWDSAHDLPVMEKTLTILTRLASQHRVKGQIPYWMERLRILLNELLLTLGSERVK